MTLTIAAGSLARPHQAGPSGVQAAPAQDGCRDAVRIRATVPQRGRLDIENRSVIVTLRMGPTMLLQRLPLNAYRGVAAQLVAVRGAEPTVRLVLRHADPTYSMGLAEGLPLEEAVAIWRGWADRLCVPLLLNEGQGEDSIVRAMLGAVMLRARQPRRARLLATRRPRFSKRRGKR